MGTLLNALRRMQQERSTSKTQPHQVTSVIVVDQGGQREHDNKASHLGMKPSTDHPAVVPERLHGSRAPQERPGVCPGYAGLARGAMDERIDETLTNVDALLSSALACGDDLQEYRGGAAELPPARGRASFADQILQIASDGSVHLPETPTNVLAEAANWQSTLETLDKELQHYDGNDVPFILEDLHDELEAPSEVIPLDIRSHDAIQAAVLGQDSQPWQRDEVAVKDDVNMPTQHLADRRQSHSVVGSATERYDVQDEQQFHEALNYAAHVVAETKHLTMDLLDTLPAYSPDPETASEISNDDREPIYAEDDDAIEWDPEPDNSGWSEMDANASASAGGEPSDVSDAEASALTWDRQAEAASVSADVDPSPAPVASVPSAFPERTSTCTAFEQELAIRMANVRYLRQCRSVAARMRQDLDDGPGGRSVVLVGCELDSDLSDVAAALGYVFSQSYGAKVLLVDGQFSRQPLSRHYHLTGTPGLTEACKSLDRWNHLVQPTFHENLHVMPAGCRLDRAHPTEDILRDLVGRMRNQFDLVILDVGEPSSPLSDPCLAAADAAYLVVQLGRTKRSQATGTITTLKERGRNLNGCIVMNTV